VYQYRFSHAYGVPLGTAWNMTGNLGPAGGLVSMPPSRSTKLWCPGPSTYRVGSQPDIIVARWEPKRQPLDLYQSMQDRLTASR
jgi:hypothetical protein